MPSWRRLTWAETGVVVGVVAVLGILALPLDIASPTEVTETTMWVVKRRIQHYAREHGVLPPDLASLPPLQGFDDRITDFWGRPLGYSVSPDGVVTLSSSVMTHSFVAKTPEGHWSDELAQWSNDTLR